MSRVSRRAFIRAGGSAATVGVLTGCLGGDGGDGGDGDGGGTASPTSSGPIVIGGLEPLSGPFAPWGAPHQAGLEFAIQDINDDGGVLGRDLELAVADTGSDAGEADSAFRRLVEQEGAVATTGAVSSDVGIRLSQTAESLQVAHVLNRAGSNKVINENSKHIFRFTLHPASRYMQAQASAFGGTYSSIGAIIADYAWGRSVEQGIKQHFDADVNIQVAPISASDFKPFIRQFDDDLEMLIASGHPPGTTSIANQTFEVGYTPEVISGAHFVPNLLASALGDQALASFAHIHTSDPYKDGFAELGGRFAEDHDSQFTTDTAYGYATAMMLAQAIEDAGETTPTVVADAIRTITFETPLMAQPVQYSEYGELEDASVIYSRVLKEAPSYDSNGNHSYEEISRSDPLPALPPEQ